MFIGLSQFHFGQVTKPKVFKVRGGSLNRVANNIHAPHSMNLFHFGHSMSFPLAPPSRQHFHLWTVLKPTGISFSNVNVALTNSHLRNRNTGVDL